MFAGFPDLLLAPPAAVIERDHELLDQDGCVKKVILEPVRRVRLAYPALCHILALSTNATRRRYVFGRICGLQVGEEVEITAIQENPRRGPAPERETPEEMHDRLREQEVLNREAFKLLEDMNKKEEMDTFQAGTFVISGATYNPFSTTLLHQLMDLYARGQPAVMLHFDPFRTGLFGRPYLRAYVPTNEYLAYYSLEAKRSRTEKPSKMVKDTKVTSHGVLREVPIFLDVDPYQTLGLATVEVQPLQTTFDAVQSDAVSDYVGALVHSVTTNTDSLIGSLGQEARNNTRENNANAPLAQRIDTLLALQHLCDQTAHLEAVCDSVLLNSSLLRDL